MKSWSRNVSLEEVIGQGTLNASSTRKPESCKPLSKANLIRQEVGMYQ